MFEITLLPEFGWSLMNEPVYGPGSVFQGSVKIKLENEIASEASQLRLVFHSSEMIYGVTQLTPVYRNQFFGSQRVLWKKNNGDLEQEKELGFIIQMPMVQYPPSCKIESYTNLCGYESQFVLSAILESADGKRLLKTDKMILYMPFVETRMFKQPLVVSCLTKSDISAHLNTMDYLPGDTLALDMVGSTAVHSFVIQLIQNQTWRKLPGQSSVPEKALQIVVAESTIKQNTHLTLHIPLNTVPSFSYSPVFSVSYHLQITIKHKAIWSSSVHIPEIPIRIGTLGYGISSSKNLKIYSDIPENPLYNPYPRFLNLVEYEESLPVYEDIRLPTYEHIA